MTPWRVGAALLLLFLGAGWSWEAVNLWRNGEPWALRAVLGLWMLAGAAREWRSGWGRG